MATSLDLSRTYTSYSGVDIKVVINGAIAGSMQALSYAIQREKAPIYVMGSVDPISYSRGKRGIAGTMISLMMDTHILMSQSFTGEHYLGDKDEVFPSYSSTDGVGKKTDRLNQLNNEVGDVALKSIGGKQFGSSLTEDPGLNGNGSYLRLDRSGATYDLSQAGNNYVVSPVFYVDQILPFDVAIVAVNEYGQSAQMRLYGCEILNEGSGFSIDDIVIENQMTYVCRTILPWRSFALKNDKGGNLRDSLYNKDGSKTIRGWTPEGGSSVADVKYADKTGALS